MSEPERGSRGEGGTEVEAGAAGSEAMDEREGRVLRKADLSLKRIVFRRKLEAPLDLRPVEALSRGSSHAASLRLSSSSRACPMEEDAYSGEGMAGSIDWLSL